MAFFVIELDFLKLLPGLYHLSMSLSFGLKKGFDSLPLPRIRRKGRSSYFITSPSHNSTLDGFLLLACSIYLKSGFADFDLEVGIPSANDYKLTSKL